MSKPIALLSFLSLLLLACGSEARIAAAPTQRPTTAATVPDSSAPTRGPSPTSDPTAPPTREPSPASEPTARPARTRTPAPTAAPKPSPTRARATSPPAPTATPKPDVTLYTGKEGGVNLRARPGEDAPVLLQLPAEAPVRSEGGLVQGPDGEPWRLVAYKGRRGYVLASLLSAKRPASASPRRAALVPVLEYHEIAEPASVLQVPLAEFRRQLDWLQANGYETVSLAQVYDAMEGKGALPPRPVLITFDDGRTSQLEAVRELNKRGMKATFFVMAGGTLLNEGQIRGILAQGHELGSHTMNHTNLKEAPEASLEEEVVDSKHRLEATYKAPVRFLSWPFGAYREEAVELMKRSGYRGAVGNGGAGPWDWSYTEERRWYQFRYIVDGTATHEEFVTIVKEASE